MDFAATLDRIIAGDDLTESDAHAWMTQCLQGELAPERLAALLTALRAKGPAVDELVGFAQAMRGHATPVDVGDCIDNCGTGGASVKTFNISTAAAFVLASAGLTVAKHGNRSITRPSGSADVLERAGARLDLDAEACAQVVREAGIGFLFAPTFHPAMRHAGPVRQALGIKTVFNLLGPLCNPADAAYQVLGVYDADLVPVMAEALARLGCRSGYVLHGLPGTDEATPCGHIVACAVRDGQAGGTLTIDPRDLGIEPCGPEAIAPVSAEDAPGLLQAILAGKETGPRADAVALNVAFGLVAAGLSPDLAHGVRKARELLRSAAGMAKWEAFIEATRAQ